MTRGCPQCGAEVARYAHNCDRCGADLPPEDVPDYGPTVVGASDAETRWSPGRTIAIIVVVLAIAGVAAQVVMYYHDRPDTGTTFSTISVFDIPPAASRGG